MIPEFGIRTCVICGSQDVPEAASDPICAPCLVALPILPELPMEDHEEDPMDDGDDWGFYEGLAYCERCGQHEDHHDPEWCQMIQDQHVALLVFSPDEIQALETRDLSWNWR